MTLWAGVQSQDEMDRQFVANTIWHLMEQKDADSVTFTELFNELSKTSVSMPTPLFTESGLRDTLKDMSLHHHYEALLDRIRY